MSRRAQDAVIDSLGLAMAGGDCFATCALPGVFVVAGFAPRDGRRWLSPSCTLWVRISRVPGQTETGWPKKVSRRAQDAIIDDHPRPEVDGDCFGPCLLAAVFAAMGYAGRSVG